MITTMLSFINLCLLIVIIKLTMKDKPKKRLEKEITIPDRKVSFLIAALFINRAIEMNKPLSNLMLNRMMFLFYTKCSVYKLESLKGKLAFEAWDYGPVCPEIYWSYSPYGATKITLRESESYLKNVKDKFKIEALVKYILDCYGYSSPWEVTDICKKHIIYISNYEEGKKNEIDDRDFW